MVLGAIIWGVCWTYKEQRWKVFLRINVWYFAGALFVFIISQFAVGLRWWLLLRTQSVYIGLWTAVRLNFLGLFYNNFMPSSMGGDLIRAWYVTRHTDRRFVAVLSIFVDRAIGLLSMVILAFCCWGMFMKGQSFTLKLPGFAKFAGEHKVVLLLFTGIVLVIACGLLLNHTTRTKLGKVYSKVKEHAIHAAKKAHDATVMYCRKPFTLIGTFGLTLCLQSLVITAFWLLGTSIPGMEVEVKYFFVFFPVSWILGTLPVSIGGVGVVEGVLYILLWKFGGAGEAEALAIVWYQRFIWWFASVPGMVINLRGAHLPKDFFVDYDKPAN
ncbi:hypothetical protein ES703_63580 [subsurface metagenome]